MLKYEHFIQILSVVQRMRKVGMEFCEDNSQKMIDLMKHQCIEFFKRYHVSCLDEINLFLENEVWIQVQSFSSVVQLQEYRLIKRSLKRHNFDGSNNMNKTAAILPLNTSPNKKVHDDSSANSQDESSSIYGSCGYFVRFSEKSSPFECTFDAKMLEEDILSGIADETSCYYSEDSSDDYENVNQHANGNDRSNSPSLVVNNTSLNILRVIGRYLQMCRLLASIAPHIIYSTTELVDFYIYAVYEIFAKDLMLPSDALFTAELSRNLKRISETIISKMKKWPPSIQMIEFELKDSEEFYALAKRINAVESCVSVIQQFSLLHGYLDHLIEATRGDASEIANERQSLKSYIDETQTYVRDLRKPIFTCVTSRAIDIQSTMVAINKVKWDINHVTVEHNSYVDIINRVSY